MADDGYTTPEGYWLARPLLIPDARAFSDVLEYVREWDHATMSHTSGRIPRPELLPAPSMIERNEVGPFCSISLTSGRRSVAVVARPAVLDVVAPRIVTDDDHLSFEVIEHKGRGRALVTLQHGYIIGSHWLAYIDPATIPPAPERLQ
jgi:hypothetical protein